ncbi:MAG: winged helix-turn-helix domain-containing protein [Candidatus Burarchaeum sp.]|nr:winged helix-turn-helix domain-containing protein [Candidatus Burarchaeum sp.]MDO8339581.1 winged helix-turn-helix domain-containing protein [Candidatus Burarchaeum sp.]
MSMADEKITLDKKSFEALAADSRVSILKSLAERQKTLTELAAQFHLSPSTVKEHMQVLEGAGLVVMKDEGRKWKYYELTWKGKNIVQPRELKIWIALGVSALAAIAALFNFFSKLPGAQAAQQVGFDGTRTMAAAATEVPAAPLPSADLSGGIVAEGLKTGAQNAGQAVAGPLGNAVQNASSAAFGAAQNTLGAGGATQTANGIQAFIPDLLLLLITAVILGISVGLILRRKI